MVGKWLKAGLFAQDIQKQKANLICKKELWILIPSVRNSVCSDEELLKVPSDVIHFNGRPVEFLDVSNDRVYKWKRFLKEQRVEQELISNESTWSVPQDGDSTGLRDKTNHPSFYSAHFTAQRQKLDSIRNLSEFQETRREHVKVII